MSLTIYYFFGFLGCGKIGVEEVVFLRVIVGEGFRFSRCGKSEGFVAGFAEF